MAARAREGVIVARERDLGARREVPSEVGPDAEGMWTKGGGTPESAALRQADAQRLDHLLATLSPDDRTLLLLRYSEELPYDELARMYHRPQGMLKMRVHRALKRLQQLAQGEAP